MIGRGCPETTKTSNTSVVGGHPTAWIWGLLFQCTNGRGDGARAGAGCPWRYRSRHSAPPARERVRFLTEPFLAHLTQAGVADTGVEQVRGVGRPKGRRGDFLGDVARHEGGSAAAYLERHEALGRGRTAARAAHRAASEGVAGVAVVGAIIQRRRAFVASRLDAGATVGVRGAADSTDVVQVQDFDEGVRTRPRSQHIRWAVEV